MKIKHWQGYGTVNAEKVSKKTAGGITTLVVRVSGNHEWGLIRDDEYDLKTWLVKRFDKSFDPGNRVAYSYDSGYRNNGKVDEEYCVYTFQYRSGCE